MGPSADHQGPNWLGYDSSFPNPWSDIASLHMPQTIQRALYYCEYVANQDGTYAQAINRVVSYFVTEVDWTGVGDDEADNWRKFFDESLDIKNWLAVIGKDAITYGNSFFSVLPGFKRYLRCSRCHRFEAPLRAVAEARDRLKYRWSGFKFLAQCPACGHDGEMQHVDRRVFDETSCRVKRWSPHDIEILWDPFTDDTRYVWKIPEEYRRAIRKGDLFHLERAPWEVVEAVRDNQHFLFEDGFVYHMRECALAGMRNRGWGISRMLSNFRQTWYVQVLRRFNEAIALDYVMPFRLLTPAPGDKQAGTDPLTNMSAGGNVARINSMLRHRKRDPAAWHVLPFALQYQALGGEAKQLAPVELIAQGQETQLANIGIPIELWKGSLTMQTAPPAIRLFEASWSSLPHGLNGALRFLKRAVARIRNWEEPDASLVPPTHADDLTAQQAILQLMMGGQVSPTTGLRVLRLRYRDEAKKILDDQKYQAELQARSQKEMESAAQMEQMASQPGGAGPGQAQGQGGGAPADQGAQGAQGGQQPAGPQGQALQDVASSLKIDENSPITPQEMFQRADTAASQLLGMSPTQRNSELRKIKQSNPHIHPYVVERLEAKRREASNQGREAVLQQQYGGG
ncbi:MAG: hypothetical protein E6G97_18510 [Alphaproteobacteria bacterium]|nr:MAG: hypothetical protein E6G97_18510 [Alphaproteobacteria bacterium]